MIEIDRTIGARLSESLLDISLPPLYEYNEEKDKKKKKKRTEPTNEQINERTKERTKN